MDMQDLRNAFCSQRYSASLRGIEFLLTFDEWLRIWIDSGRLADRGRKKGQYCMARFGDVGPYAVGNVKVVTNIENNAERKCSDYQREVLRRPRSVESNLKRSNTLKGREISLEHRKKISTALTGIKRSEETKIKVGNASRGRKDSEETRCKKVESAKRRAARERIARLERLK